MAEALERLLGRAARDPELREAVLADPVAAAQAEGLDLTPTEVATLQAAGAAQLRRMIETLSQHDGPLTEGPVLAPELIECTGIRPDHPAYASQGIRPDRPEQVKGIRPGRVILATAAAATLLGAGAYYVSAGNRPHRPTNTPAEPLRDAGDPAGDAGLDAGVPERPPAPEKPPERK